MALSQEQLALRRTGISATDAAALVGLSPWKTAGDVWVEKKHPEALAAVYPDAAQEARFEWGLRDEPALARKYEEITGEILSVARNITQINKNVPWMLCTPDAQIVTKPKGVELKTTESRGLEHDWGDPGTDQVPPHYLIQCQWSMMVMDFQEWDLAVRIGLYKFAIYHLFWNQELVDLLFAACHDFYHRCIAGKERPEYDWGKKLRAYVMQQHKAVPRKELVVTTASDASSMKAVQIASTLCELRREREILNASAKNIESLRLLLATQMGDISRAKWPEEKMSVSFLEPKKPTSTKLNYKALVEALLPRFDGTPEEKENLIKAHTFFKNNTRVLRVYDKKAQVTPEEEHDDAEEE